MITQSLQLKDKLSENGWKISKIDEKPSKWWADEQWIIKSEWSPQGFTVYLTFLVDPQWDGTRKKSEGVWAIGASLDLPDDRPSAEGVHLIPIRPQWEKRLPNFITEINGLRNL